MALAFIFSIVLSILCFVFLDPLCRFLGSDEALLPGIHDFEANRRSVCHVRYDVPAQLYHSRQKWTECVLFGVRWRFEHRTGLVVHEHIRDWGLTEAALLKKRAAIPQTS